MNVIYCDSCGDSMPPPAKPYSFTGTTEISMYGGLMLKESWDLCSTCQRVIQRMATAFKRAKEEAK